MAEGTAKTIDQLPTKENILGTDFFPIDDGTQSYKATWEALLKLTGGIESAMASGNTLTITTKGGQVYSLTLSDSNKQDALTFDATPTAGSGNPVTSGGVYDAVHEVSTALATEASTAREAEEANARAIATLNGDSATEGSVEHTVKEALDNVEVAVDSEMSDSSTNPVQNKVITGKMKSTSQADKAYHLGFYLDADGDLCYDYD